MLEYEHMGGKKFDRPVIKSGYLCVLKLLWLHFQYCVILKMILFYVYN